MVFCHLRIVTHGDACQLVLLSFADEPNQIVGKIVQSVKVADPIFAMLLDGLSICDEFSPRQPHVASAIPCIIAASYDLGTLEFTQKSRQEGIEFDEMRVFGLRIDLPDERSLCPLGSNERILASYKIDVARPQQSVVVRLRKKRHGMHSQ